MCRMLGVASREPFLIGKWLVDASPGLLGLSLQGKGAPHRDGLGYAFRDPQGQWRLFRFGPGALAAPGVPGPLASPATMLLAHARKASPEYRAFRGGLYAHPFFYEGVFLCHNGTIRDLEGLGAGPGTDSQRLLFWLVRHWHPRTPARLRALLTQLLAMLQDYSALNLLLSDGLHLYALCAYTRDPDYFTLWIHEGADGLAVASEPADGAKAWNPLENHELLVVSPGGDYERQKLP